MTEEGGARGVLGAAVRADVLFLFRCSACLLRIFVDVSARPSSSGLHLDSFRRSGMGDLAYHNMLCSPHLALQPGGSSFQHESKNVSYARNSRHQVVR